MSLTSALSIALSGLHAATTQLQLASNNIANAQTPGYTTKSANLSAVVFGSGEGGVSIDSYKRSTDAALTTAFNTATAQSSFYGTTNGYLSQVQSLLGSNSSNPALSSALANFQSAWTQFSSSPENATQQQTVIQAGVNLANQIKNIASGITVLTQQVGSDITTTASTLTANLAKVANLNAQIAAATGANQPTGDLEDQRDQIINSIASTTNVTVLPRSEGQVALYTPGGLLLLDAGSPETFTYNGTDIVSSTGQIVTSSLTGGSLQAQLNFLSGSATSTDPGTGVIGKLNAQITAIATSLTDATAGTPQTFANAYNSATTATGELGSGFFTITGTDPSSIGVNASLLNGSLTLKQASGASVVAALSAQRTFTASGLSVTGTYSDLGTGFLSGFQQAANTISALSTTSTQQYNFYQQTLSNETGVNVDTELTNLTVLQNSYAASAHVLTTINAMLATLENTI